MRIDLHNHTIHSDGVLTEEELVKRAVKNNVDIYLFSLWKNIGILNKQKAVRQVLTI